MITTADLIDSRYRIMRNIGSGAMGSVFLVHDEKLDKMWAAKLVKNISSNELLALKSVNHPAFPRLVDTVCEKDYIWLIMDYMEGVSLREYVNSSKFGKDMFKSIAIQLAKAIDYLHMHTPSMLYLDCKPDNIIIDKNGLLHMIDLGSIYLVNQSNPGRISGTAGFASPEQRLGKLVDARSDIYSYGMTLRSIMPGPSTPPELLSMIKRCTSNSPSKRYQSMHEILEYINNPHIFKICTLQSVLKKFSLTILYTIFAFFVVLSFKSYNSNNNNLFLILAIGLLATLLSLMEKHNHAAPNSHWVCHRDIYLSRGLRTLPSLIITIILSALLCNMYTDAAPIHEYTDEAYRVNMYTSKNEKILYYGQKLTINPDGSATLSIPLSSLTLDSLPAKMELIRKY